MTMFLDDLLEALASGEVSWDTLAACRDEDPELFFPVGSSDEALRQAAKAKLVCARCPVRPECLAEAVALRDFYGVRGGLDEQERTAMHRNSVPPPRAVKKRHPRTNMRWPKRADQ